MKSVGRASGTSRRPGRRLVLAVLALLIVSFVAGAVTFGSSAPIGYFRSAAGQSAYLTAYESALSEGPAPTQRMSIDTEFGVVRVLRYAATRAAAADADPLLLLPGTQSGAPMWIDNIPALRAERSVYVVDLLGQPGRSVQSRPITTHEDDARWLAQVLEQLPGDPAVLGHSLGGWLAINLAVHEPAAASRIVVLDPVLTFGDLAPSAVVRSIPASMPWLPKSWRDDFASWTANGAPVQDEPVAAMIEAGMQHFSLGTPTPTRFRDDQLQAIDVPVLVIMAGRSRMHDSAEGRRNAERLLARGSVLSYAEASHAINGEEPERIGQDVASFLKD